MDGTIMSKEAVTDHSINELIVKRWSPYGFADRPVSQDDLCSLFEAARWAASSYNEQPWSYIVATKGDIQEFERLLSCLVEPNQAWAKAASVLVLCCTSLNFARNNKPNAAAIQKLAARRKTLFPSGRAATSVLGFMAEAEFDSPRLAVGHGTWATAGQPWKPLEYYPKTRQNATICEIHRNR